MNRFKGICFDFDGTLADTRIGVIRTFQATFREMGLEVPSEEKISSTIGLVLPEAFGKASSQINTPQLAEEAASIYRRVFPEVGMAVTTAFEGVPQLLETLRESGIIMMVTTSRSHASLEALAEQLGIRSYFVAMYGAEDVVNHKPAPDLVNLALEKQNLRPEEVLVVGDTVFDLLMGQGAGCAVCGVTWGNHSAAQLRCAKPDFVVDTISELLQLSSQSR